MWADEWRYCPLAGLSTPESRRSEAQGSRDRCLTSGLKVRCRPDVTSGQAISSDNTDSVLGSCLATIRETYPRLAAVVAAWPDLPAPIRAAILAMIRSTTGEHGQ